MASESEIEDHPAVAHILLGGWLSLHYDGPFFLWRGRDSVVGCSEGGIVAVAHAVLIAHRVHEFGVRCTCSRKNGGVRMNEKPARWRGGPHPLCR